MPAGKAGPASAWCWPAASPRRWTARSTCPVPWAWAPTSRSRSGLLHLGTELVAQLTLDDLAVVVGGQRVHEPVLLGPLEPGDGLQARPIELLDRGRLVLDRHDERHHGLAPLGVRA